MSIRITQEQFLARMAGMHPAYDFSSFKYLGNAVKSTVICKEHGPFEIHPNALTNGQGCRACGIARRAAKKVGNFNDFLLRAREVHGGRFDYDEASWAGMTKQVKALCTTHGTTFKQRADVHLRALGCPHCRKEHQASVSSTPQAKFIEQCQAVHGSLYDLSKVVYTSMTKKIEVVCHVHGSFFARAGNFVHRKSGCPLCARDLVGVKSRAAESSYISRAVIKHGGAYTYGKVSYVGGVAYLTVICEKHGRFKQMANDHLKGCGCLKCSKPVHDHASFLEEARKVHGDTYDYSKTVYAKALEPVVITCKTHGDFTQAPTYHVNSGHGCPKCGMVLTSKGQAEVADVLRPHVEIDENYKLPSGKHLDIFIPSLNIGVEYHGLIWHSERFQASHMRDYTKHKEAAALGIRVIHVYSDEWAYRGHVVTSMLQNLVGVNKGRVFARDCKIEAVTDQEAWEFYEDHHIQGGVGTPCYNIGLSHRGKLVAVMSFSRVTSIRGSRETSNTRELRRFASACNVVGGASKLLQSYLRCFKEVTTVISYSDNRLFSGATYQKLGFRLDAVSEPSYCYVHPNVKWREEKYQFTRARMAKRQGFVFDPDKSEKENCAANNWYRVYDCGKTKWVFSR